MLDFVNIEQQEAGFVPFGTDLVNPDFSQVATALGARGIRVEEPGHVRDALQAALAHTDGPIVVDVVVDRYALGFQFVDPVGSDPGHRVPVDVGAVAVWVPKTSVPSCGLLIFVDQAPSRRVRRTCLGGRGVYSGPLGGRWPSVWCGRWVL